MMKHIAPIAATLVLLAPGFASAQTTTYVPEDEIKQNEAEAELKAGRIDGTLGISASLSMNSNQNVVGQTDGFSTLFGVGLVGGLDYLRGNYEMRNTLKLNESFARTPAVPEFLKTNDVVDVENLHNYFFTKWMGAFGRFNLRTNLFSTYDVRSEDINYVLVDDEGAVVDSNINEPVVGTSAQTVRTRLNGSFAPLDLSESLGVFAEPIRTVPFNLSTRVGFGARQTLADGVRIVADDAATENVVEVKSLENVVQAGAEAFVGIKGSLENKRITYTVGGSAMLPFLNNDARSRSTTELARLAAEANVTFNVVEWLNIVYSGKAIRDPQLIDDIQLQNNLLLTFQYTLIERNQAKPTDPDEIAKAQKLAAEADKKAKEADAKAKEAEARAAEAEKKAAEAQRLLEEERKKKEAEANQPATEPETPEAPEAPEAPENPAPENPQP